MVRFILQILQIMNMLEAVHFSKLHIQRINLHCWYLLTSRNEIRRQTNNNNDNNKMNQEVVQIICGINGR